MVEKRSTSFVAPTSVITPPKSDAHKDIFTVLADDHKRIESMLGELPFSETRRESLIRRFFVELYAHLRAEEEILYKLLPQWAFDPAVAKKIEEGLLQHHAAEQVLLRFISDYNRADRGSTERWTANFTALNGAILSHADVEEAVTFKHASEVIAPDVAQAAAEEFRSRRAGLAGSCPTW